MYQSEIEKIITCGHIPKKNETNGKRQESCITLNTKTKPLDLCWIWKTRSCRIVGKHIMWIVEGDIRYLETDIFQRIDFIRKGNIFLYEAFYEGSIE